MNSDQFVEEIFALGLQPASEQIPKPIPVVETNPKQVRRPDVFASVSATASAATNNILVSVTGRNFVLCGYGLSYVKDATCDHATSNVSIRIPSGGSTVRYVARLAVLTLTAQSGNLEVSLNRPIKCDVATLLLETPTFTVGNFVRTAYVWGYYEDANKGLPTT